MPLFVLQTAPPRSHSWPHCCSWPPFSELGRGTYTCLRLGTGTCTQWPRRAGCCGDRTEVRLVTHDTPVQFTDSWWEGGTNKRGYWKEGGSSPFHEVDHIDDARCTDHGLVSEDGPHGLFHTKLWLQGRQKWLNLLPKWTEKISVCYLQAQNIFD